MGVPGAGKSYLAARLHERGIGAFRELEPELRERFGSGAEFNAHIREAGAFVWQSYQEQLAAGGPTPIFGSAGVDDRVLLELLDRRYAIAFIHVRPPEQNINHTTDRERVGRSHDLWYAKIFPTYRFALTVDGEDASGACDSIAGFLRGQ
jgi:hypothetical protein